MRERLSSIRQAAPCRHLRRVSALIVALLALMAVGCPKPVEVTYEVRSMSAMEASIQYWEEPGEKQVKLERQALPFRKTVQIAHPGDWSTNVTAQVAMGQDVTCAVYFNGEQVRIENTSFLCVANAHYR